MSFLKMLTKFKTTTQVTLLVLIVTIAVYSSIFLRTFTKSTTKGILKSNLKNSIISSHTLLSANTQQIQNSEKIGHSNSFHTTIQNQKQNTENQGIQLNIKEIASNKIEMTYPFVSIRKIKSGKQQNEGQGAKVIRTIGNPSIQDVLDPFLLLDEFSVVKPAGFPNHPHRGFQTVTYMLEGTFTHKDNAGHHGTIGEGSIQWMNAGRGIIHSEMPGPGSVNRGLQLWVNLAAKDKMSPPDYQEYNADQLPKKVLDNGAKLTVIAGDSHDISSPIKLRTKVLYTHIQNLKKGESYDEVIPEGYQGFLYVLSGKGEILDEKPLAMPTKSVVIFDETTETSRISIKSVDDEPLEFAVIAGTPLKEPIARYGPFVMNTNEEINQAFMDYHNGKFTST